MRAPSCARRSTQTPQRSPVSRRSGLPVPCAWAHQAPRRGGHSPAHSENCLRRTRQGLPHRQRQGDYCRRDRSAGAGLSMGKLHHAMMGTCAVAIGTAAAIPAPRQSGRRGGRREAGALSLSPGTLSRCPGRAGRGTVDGHKAVMSRSARIPDGRLGAGPWRCLLARLRHHTDQVSQTKKEPQGDCPRALLDVSGRENHIIIGWSSTHSTFLAHCACVPADELL